MVARHSVASFKANEFERQKGVAVKESASLLRDRQKRNIGEDGLRESGSKMAL